jgi:hypothetical protein
VKGRGHQHPIDPTLAQAVDIFPALYSTTSDQFDLRVLDTDGLQERFRSATGSSAHSGQVEYDQVAASHLDYHSSQTECIAFISQAPRPPVTDQFTVAQIDREAKATSALTL